MECLGMFCAEGPCENPIKTAGPVAACRPHLQAAGPSQQVSTSLGRTLAALRPLGLGRLVHAEPRVLGQGLGVDEDRNAGELARGPVHRVHPSLFDVGRTCNI